VTAGHAGAHAGAPTLDGVLLAIALLAVAVYAIGALASRRRGRAWPAHRVLLWSGGIAAATATVVGPLAEAAHGDFVAHMWAHLLGGMLAPLLLVLSAPVTLALRTLHATPARRISRLLRSAPARVVAHPVTAGVLSAGGLWAVYLTPVLDVMMAVPLAHVLLQAHLLVAGYLFTAAVIGLDPAPHAPRRVLVAVVLLLSMASHAVLSKYLYAHPPASLAAASVREGAQLMYYAGAWVEAVIVVIFCARWYVAAGRRPGAAVRAGARDRIGRIRPLAAARQASSTRWSA
jgi:putative membrane protein